MAEQPMSEHTAEQVNQLNSQGASRDHLERMRMAFPNINWGKLINFVRKYSGNVQEMITELVDVFNLPPRPVEHPRAEKE